MEKTARREREKQIAAAKRRFLCLVSSPLLDAAAVKLTLSETWCE